MRRLFHQTKLYDYSSKQEAEKHIKEMQEKGWHPMKRENGESIYPIEGTDYKFSVEFFKEL